MAKVWAAIVVTCVVVGVAYRMRGPVAVETPEPPIFPVGWVDLAPCAFLATLDGARELTLTEDNLAKLWDLTPLKDGEDSKNRQIDGTWAYDQASKRYAIALAGQTTTYLLLARGDPVTCILLKGELRSADLSASWFSFPSNDDLDPRDYDNRE